MPGMQTDDWFLLLCNIHKGEGLIRILTDAVTVHYEREIHSGVGGQARGQKRDKWNGKETHMFPLKRTYKTIRWSNIIFLIYTNTGRPKMFAKENIQNNAPKVFNSLLNETMKLVQ